MTPNSSIAYEYDWDDRARAQAAPSLVQVGTAPSVRCLSGLLMAHLLVGFCTGLAMAVRLLVSGQAWWMVLLGYTGGGTLIVALSLARAMGRGLRTTRA